MRIAFCILASCIASLLAQPAGKLPRFEDFPVSNIYSGKPAVPILAAGEQWNYRTRIRRGVQFGEDVWDGDITPLRKASGPNFAGHYIAITWGCGSQCAMMAIVDALTGRVHGPPLSGVGTELWVPFDHLSEMKTQFRADSELFILRNGCRDFKDRATCGVYYFRWHANQFELLRFVLESPRRP